MEGKLKLLSLKLKNFKGIKSFEFTPNGGNASIFGENATGKTTVADACYWLLFGKDSQGKKEFGIKTYDASGKEISNLDHEVEGVFSINGKRKTLHKVYVEVWARNSKSATEEFSGHETKHFIDGVPVKKNEYDSAINSIAKEDLFKMLTSPLFFSEQLAWKKQRDIIFEVCGNKTDAEVIASNGKLAKLTDILGDYDIESYKKIITARLAKVNEAKKEKPIRIDEVTLGLPDISGLDSAKIAVQIAEQKDLLKKKQENILLLESGGEVVQKKNELLNVESEILQLKNEHRDSLDKLVIEKRVAMNETRVKADALKYDIRSKESEIIANQNKISALSANLTKGRELWHTENAKTFEFAQETVCPTCGQDLPEDKLAEARAKAEEAFNLVKAEKLTKINTDGTASKTEMEALEQNNVELQSKVADLKVEQATADAEVTKLQQEIDSIQESNQLHGFPGYLDAMSKKVDLDTAILKLKDGNSDAVAKVKEEVAVLEGVIAQLDMQLKSIKSHGDDLKRIKELESEEKQLGVEVSKLSGELFLLGEFTKAKVALLTDNINGRFKLTKFKMFNVLINGGVEDCCEALVNTNGAWVPYSIANNAGRINSGLDIINTLSEHYGFTPPIFIDNRESVTEVIDTKAQTVSLIVSAKDKKLRIEMESAKNKEVA